MRSVYNRLAGQNHHRLEALSDGVFAVAMTLLVLDLHAPARDAIHSERDLIAALTLLAPNLMVYGLSFLTLGIFWVGQQTQLNQLARADRDVTWIHLAFLCAVTLLPFVTGLMAAFIQFRIALILYWANTFALGALLYLSWNRATRNNLLRDDIDPEYTTGIERRILRAQALYLVLLLFGLWHPPWGLAGTIIVQLNYALAPRNRWLQRL